jgi:hypothetical protein
VAASKVSSVVVGRDHEHAAVGDGRGAVDGFRVAASSPRARSGVELGHEAEARGDVELAVGEGDAAAEAQRSRSPPRFLSLATDAGPCATLRAALGVEGADRGLPSITKILAAGHDRRSGDLERPSSSLLAEALTPGDGSVAGVSTCSSRLLGVAARQRPFGDGGRIGQEKSAPFRAVAGSTFWSKAMIEMRWPWLAVSDLFSFLACGRD